MANNCDFLDEGGGIKINLVEGEIGSIEGKIIFQ